MTEINKVKDRIRKLLNLAGGEGAYDGEIANAMRFAKALMDEHNLSEDDLEKVDQKIVDLERAEMKTGRCSTGSRKMYAWEGHLASFVSQFVGGVGVYSDPKVRIQRRGKWIQTDENGETKYAKSFVFYGIAEDVMMATELYEEMYTTIVSMARIKYAKVYRGEGRSYCEGFVSGLFVRLAEDDQKQKEIADSQKRLGMTGTSLVLVEKRNELVQAKKQHSLKWLRQEKGIRLGKRQSSNGGRHFKDAYKEGHEDGKSSEVSKQRTMKIGC